MRTAKARFILCSILFLSALTSLHAQDIFRKQLFGEADELLVKTKEARSEFYAPTSYQKALGYYNKALSKFNDGSAPEDVREYVKDAELYLAKALDASIKGEATFRPTMNARTDATKAGALKSSLEIYNKAEEKFIRAAYKLEDGDETGAHEYASEAEALYRSAELEAIKSNFLSPARELLAKAEQLDVSDNAPITLAKSRRLVTQAEALLKQNRYDTDSARELAQTAKYEAAHAIYLHRVILGLKNQKRTFEDVFLESETQFQRVAGGLGIRARFDNGFNGPVDSVNSAIKGFDQKFLKDADTIHQLSNMIQQKDRENENLKEQVASIQSRVGTLTDKEKELQTEGKKLTQVIELTRKQEETIRGVSGRFTDEEASVIRERDNIVIRLYGLSFASGKDVIESQFYPLLTKVQDAIRKFPNAKVTIEGHTDSQGPDDLNQTLSERRANAVAEYFMANMNVERPIGHQGYGESRPIASNDTPEGRAKNRRIDVVITPEGAGN